MPLIPDVLPDEQRGLYPKYRAFKLLFPTSEVIDPGMEVTEPFFLLKFSDPHARDALREYAHSCALRYPKLSEDILQKLRETAVPMERETGGRDTGWRDGGELEVEGTRPEFDVTEQMREKSHEFPYGQGNQGPGTGPDGERLI